MRTVLAIILFLGFFVSCDEKTKTVVIEERNPAPTPQIPNIPPPVPPLPGLVSFDAFESEIVTDLTSLITVQQFNARYITICDQYNAAALTPSMRRAIEKGINQLSLEPRVEAGQWIGRYKCTLRIDLRDYGLTTEKWDLIEDADPLEFESFTDRGEIIKIISQTDRAWIHGTNFLETALINETYYDILEIPKDLDMFLNNYLGCALQKDFDEFDDDLFLAGLRKSLISLQKNRSILITDCDDGLLAATYDVILENVTSDGRNLSINPFPIEARTNRTFEHDASEYIFTLPNNMLGYALFDSQNIRQNFAPTDVVADNARSDIDPTIRNARSCSSCHAAGFIPVDDFIANHVRGNPNFDAEEIQKAQAYFGRNAGMKASMAQANKLYQDAVEIIQVDINNPDPINELTDNIRREMNAKQIASILFLDENDFIERLRGSANGSLIVGQLLKGGAISFQDFIQVAPVLVEDLNLFQEDLGQ